MIEIALKMLFCLIIAAILGAIIGFLIGRLLKCKKDDDTPHLKDYDFSSNFKSYKEDEFIQSFSSTQKTNTFSTNEIKTDKPKETQNISLGSFAKLEDKTKQKEEKSTQAKDDIKKEDKKENQSNLEEIVKKEIGISSQEESDEDISKPLLLKEPRNGKPDDLKEISGIGLKLEKLLNELGIYHFDQIASWTQKELNWIDKHLSAFKGRAKREKWVEQAKILASGGVTEFSQRVRKGQIERYEEKE